MEREYRQLLEHFPVYRSHLWNRWLPILSYKDISQCLEDAIHHAAMYLRVRSIQIAQRFRESAAYGLAYIPFVFEARENSRVSHCKPQFKRHVEARSRRSVEVQLDSG